MPRRRWTESSDANPHLRYEEESLYDQRCVNVGGLQWAKRHGPVYAFKFCALLNHVYKPRTDCPSEYCPLKVWPRACHPQIDRSCLASFLELHGTSPDRLETLLVSLVYSPSIKIIRLVSVRRALLDMHWIVLRQLASQDEAAVH